MTISLRQTFVEEGGRTREVKSDMNIVDLAGSEKASATVGLSRERVAEGVEINKSLTALGNGARGAPLLSWHWRAPDLRA